jgi:hypothetical protein
MLKQLKIPRAWTIEVKKGYINMSNFSPNPSHIMAWVTTDTAQSLIQNTSKCIQRNTYFKVPETHIHWGHPCIFKSYLRSFNQQLYMSLIEWFELDYTPTLTHSQKFTPDLVTAHTHLLVKGLGDHVEKQRNVKTKAGTIDILLINKNKKLTGVVLCRLICWQWGLGKLLCACKEIGATGKLLVLLDDGSGGLQNAMNMVDAQGVHVVSKHIEAL